MRKPFKKDPGYAPRINKNGQFRGWAWFVIPQWEINIAAPAKAGSSALKQFMWMNEISCSYVPVGQVNQNYETCFVARHPLSRFMSLWRSKCRDKASIMCKEVHGMSPTELMDFIEGGSTDVHWTPQVTLLNGLTATLVPLDLLGFWWKQRGYGTLEKFNVTGGDVEIDESLRARILKYYAADVLLHNKAECDFCWDTCKPTQSR